MSDGNGLREMLRTAAVAAKDALSASLAHRDALLAALTEFERAVDDARVEVPAGQPESVKQATAAFGTEYDQLRASLDGHVERTAEALDAAYVDQEKDSRFVTLMLFGRTRAGKSTTMEALTGGNGATIGVGRQHTTTDVRAYYFPGIPSGEAPPFPSLRIVDTPGIEGFEGDALAAMAEEFVERSDHILFLLSDDKATSGELDRFGAIGTQGKGVTVLLNVKAKDEDLDLLVEEPGAIFREEELDGHRRRISGYLHEHFGMSAPPVIPIHARAAWLARSGQELPEGVSSHAKLGDASGIRRVEDRIWDFIRYEAIPARLRAPRDLLNGYLWSTKNELRPFAGRFRDLMRTLDDLATRLERGAERARRRSQGRLPRLRARFQAASDAVPAMADEVISARGTGATLNSRWKELLRVHGIVDSVEWFVDAGQRDFEEEVAEEIRVAVTDFAATDAKDLDDVLEKYHSHADRSKNNKGVRAGVRAGAGAGAAALTAWAIGNWWNPTGWAAAAAVAATIVAGVAGEQAARAATDRWERASKKEMFEHRSTIVGKLRETLWQDHSTAQRHCKDWIDRTKAAYVTSASAAVRPVHRAAENLWRATVDALDRLDVVAAEIDSGLVRDVLRCEVPEVEDGSVTVDRVARLPGFATKVAVSSSSARNGPIACCVGPQGRRVGNVMRHLGGERVDFVDSDAPHTARVAQALGLPRLEPDRVTFSTREGLEIAHVAVAQRDAARAIGPKGQNARLAERLLGIRIQIGEGR